MIYFDRCLYCVISNKVFSTNVLSLSCVVKRSQAREEKRCSVVSYL